MSKITDWLESVRTLLKYTSVVIGEHCFSRLLEVYDYSILFVMLCQHIFKCALVEKRLEHLDLPNIGTVF